MESSSEDLGSSRSPSCHGHLLTTPEEHKKDKRPTLTITSVGQQFGLRGGERKEGVGALSLKGDSEDPSTGEERGCQTISKLGKYKSMDV